MYLRWRDQLVLLALTFVAMVLAEHTNQIIVKIKPGVDIKVLQRLHPFVKFKQSTKFDRIFVYSVENIQIVEQETLKFINDPRVVWAQVNDIIEDLPSAITIPRDESLLSGSQWFHRSINSSYGWSQGFSGQGQVVQVIDSEFFPNERDLRNQLNFERSFEGTVTESSGESHATVCANIIAAESNDYCGVGIAFSAQIAAFPFISNPHRRFSELNLAEAWVGGFPVSSNSYGASVCSLEGGCSLQPPMPPLLTEALETAQDRYNTVFVFAAGNEGRLGSSSNFARYAASPRIISVGASTIEGRFATYSNGGSSLWIVAPAGDFDSNTTWTSAIREGVQTCGDFGVGTSWATPMVSGAAAVLRSAFPALTWRDVKLILAHSSDRIDPSHVNWIRNAAGNWFNWFYGFGQVNVGRAVELASTWQLLAPLQVRTFRTNLRAPVPLNTQNPNFFNIGVPHGLINRIESVEISLTILISPRGALRIDLVSPSGVNHVVFPARRDFGDNYVRFGTAVNGFLGEDPGGTWQVRAAVNERFVPLNATAHVFGEAQLTIWGDTATSQIVPQVSNAEQLSTFAIQQGEGFHQLAIEYHEPESLGVYWRDDHGLYAEVFDRSGVTQTGSQHLNPSESNHPTVSVFSEGDHVVTYIINQNNSVRVVAEVQNRNFIPLTPLTVLAMDRVNDSSLSVATLGINSFAISYVDTETQLAKVLVFEVDFGSRNVTPLCVPLQRNFTTMNTTDIGDDTECQEITYQRDGSIRSVRQIALEGATQVDLFNLGRGYLFGTWSIQGSQRGFMANRTSDPVFAIFPTRSLSTAVATPQEVIFGFKFSNRVTLARFDYNLNSIEAMDIPIASSVVNLDLAYDIGSDALSLLIATSQNILTQIYMRNNNGGFALSNEATLANLLTPIPVLAMAQVVMPSGDLAVTYSTIQEIRVQVLGSSIFRPLVAPSADGNQPSGNSVKRLPSWAIALIVIGCLLVVSVVGVIVWIQVKKRRLQYSKDEPLYSRM